MVPLEEPVVREVALVLREWADIWKRLYVVGYAFVFFIIAHFTSCNLRLIEQIAQYSIVECSVSKKCSKHRRNSIAELF